MRSEQEKKKSGSSVLSIETGSNLKHSTKEITYSIKHAFYYLILILLVFGAIKIIGMKGGDNSMLNLLIEVFMSKEMSLGIVASLFVDIYLGSYFLKMIYEKEELMLLTIKRDFGDLKILYTILAIAFLFVYLADIRLKDIYSEYIICFSMVIVIITKILNNTNIINKKKYYEFVANINIPDRNSHFYSDKE